MLNLPLVLAVIIIVVNVKGYDYFSHVNFIQKQVLLITQFIVLFNRLRNQTLRTVKWHSFYNLLLFCMH